MPRKRRFYRNGYPVHSIPHGDNSPVFFTSEAGFVAWTNLRADGARIHVAALANMWFIATILALQPQNDPFGRFVRMYPIRLSIHV